MNQDQKDQAAFESWNATKNWSDQKDDAAAYEGFQAAIKYAREEDKWIACSERLPEDDRRVLCFWNSGGEGVGFLERGHWYSCIPRSPAPTHWQDLPAPPKGAQT